MACGLPIVAADAHGIADLLAGGETAGGIIVPRSDAPALARALGELLDDPERARTLGARARARVEDCCALDQVGRRLRRFILS